MLKDEFESLIGKEVDVSTFEMYEKMYTALPDNVDKVRFVSMLNIDAIPESVDAIRRREEQERLISNIKNEIAEKRADIRFLKGENERYRIMLNDEDCSEMRDTIKHWIRCNKNRIENLQCEVNDLQFVVRQG